MFCFVLGYIEMLLCAAFKMEYNDRDVPVPAPTSHLFNKEEDKESLIAKFESRFAH